MAADDTRHKAVPYFFGRISRDEAEAILEENGCKEGLYLLRENILTAGNYALTICHQGRKHHYSIERQPDGQVMIPDGRKFPGPVELITHHSQFLDGFLTKPKIPCRRPNGVGPIAWPGVTMLELEQYLLLEGSKKKHKSHLEPPDDGLRRQKLIAKVAQKLHKDQPWFHSSITRQMAEKILENDGHQDGKYLVREKDKNSFALSVSVHGVTKHYKIDVHKRSGVTRLAIEDGPPFENLMDLVAHYHSRSDGLLCKLTIPVQRKGYKKKEVVVPGTSDNPLYGAKVAEMGISKSAWEDDPCEEPADDTNVTQQPYSFNSRDRGVDYEILPRTEDVFNLNENDIKLTRTLGQGNFGSVMLGEYRRGGRTIPVAIKTLKQSDISTAEDELMQEARTMANFVNKYIIRMIGVCRSNCIMLVLELAPLGPLNKYLKMNPTVTVENIALLMQQVAEGMAYLEGQKFVHRDLAARNVLLANEQLAKISDFGMSKAIGIGNQYYKAKTTGKWPIKWYAPESIYFYKFDSKTDVWSYGVTLWEAMSYGDKPYKGMKGGQIVAMIDDEKRLKKPEKCSPQIYALMLRCWERKSEDRPTFQQIAREMNAFL